MVVSWLSSSGSGCLRRRVYSIQMYEAAQRIWLQDRYWYTALASVIIAGSPELLLSVRLNLAPKPHQVPTSAFRLLCC